MCCSCKRNLTAIAENENMLEKKGLSRRMPEMEQNKLLASNVTHFYISALL